jgi:signal transduction histidine kinase
MGGDLMRYVYWARARVGRLLAVVLALVVYLLLLSSEALRFIPQQVSDFALLFGFSSLVALLFLAVGALVWFYARDRRVALLLFGFCVTVMITFAGETGTLQNDPLFELIVFVSSGLALSLFAALLLFFPRDYFAGLRSGNRPARRYSSFLLRGYAVVLALTILDNCREIIYFFMSLRRPDWINTLQFSYTGLVLIGILVTILLSYRHATSVRARQQRRIFVSGVVLAFAPLLLLTVLPEIWNSPLAVPGQYSAITFVLLPLALGYSILRYQILIFDAYIRRAAAWIVGVIYLALFGFVVIAISNLLLSDQASMETIYVAIVMTLLCGPVVWWLAHLVTDRLFFSEINHYRRLVDQPGQLSREKLDISGAARLITMAATNVFGTREACLYVLDDDSGQYQLYPPLADDDASDAPRHSFVQRLLRAINPSSTDGAVDVYFSLLQDIDWLSLHRPVMDIIGRITSAERPLFLSEASRQETARPKGLARYLMTTAPLEFDPLFAPIRAQGKVIAILVLGERGDNGQYAGPDFEAIALIESRYSPVLETARLDAQASRHVAILDALYSGISTASGVGKADQSVEEVAAAYTRIASEALQAGAETWLCHGRDRQLRHVIHVGSGPELLPSDISMSPRDSDWSSLFYQGESLQPWQGSSSEIPSCLPQAAHFPFAWLPLKGGKQHVGVLVLTYPRPHLFSQEEQRVLSMFADQFAVALENASFTVELRAAYERQKELDRLKDQFIMTASHELRTPLTAVQGYIELLETYNHNLSSERRAEFIMKAHRGCDELTLLVENIMDASRVQVDTENLNLIQVTLLEPVTHITEMLEGVTRHEQRTVNVAIPADAYVMADELRLRQVLLNLVSNALKYSSPQSDIDITASMKNGNVNVSIRDRGQGVPPQDQARLFKRFVRLERDMNSPIRGAGLGLYISKRLIEAMGGRIWVESTGKAGEGSVFTFTLKRVVLTQEMSESALERQQAL